MDYSQPFSVLNARLKPCFIEQINSSLDRLEERQWSSLRSKSPSNRETAEPAGKEPGVPGTTAEPEKPGDHAEQEDSASDGPEEDNSADLLPVSHSYFFNVEEFEKIIEGKAEEDGSTSQSEEKDAAGELASEATVAGEGSGFQSRYVDGTLPDLVKSGRPLTRRRTLGHVSATLNEVRREVELSRRRSIKLKAQVDKLQERREGPGWSQHRERVTEEVLSVLRLLRPLTEPEGSPAEPSEGERCLDDALSQLQNVARKLAFSHTKQDAKSKEAKGDEDSAILQQALRDRDEAIEKKKAMEAELLKSKTELMLLNNQLLEAVQRRLELSLELEAWKEDVQVIVHQHLLSQQAEQAQKKSSRGGILRRNNKPVNQRPSNFPLPAAAAPLVNSNQIFITSSALSAAATPSAPPSPSPQRTWRDRLRVGRSSRQTDQDASGQIPASGGVDGFQVISLD
ncbi:bicaudal-D-related protein 2-like [Betta splendens]|uniref:Bicaudal-D-related protein 2-like n=1 Tax=Betta splendens TaxID=158456 RepID=A0A6P7P9U0_BETSP|nr:bicaudal-D-related protein 2-like [Betta splendens]